MDRWTEQLYTSMRVFHPAIVIYYILAIFVGGFFSLNMIIAVLKMHYAVQAEKYEEKLEQQVEQSKRSPFVKIEIEEHQKELPES